jgi:hypothetical protein
MIFQKKLRSLEAWIALVTAVIWMVVISMLV